MAEMILTILILVGAVILAQLIWRHIKNARVLYEVETEKGCHLVGPLRYKRLSRAGLVKSERIVQ